MAILVQSVIWLGILLHAGIRIRCLGKFISFNYLGTSRSLFWYLELVWYRWENYLYLITPKPLKTFFAEAVSELTWSVSVELNVKIKANNVASVFLLEATDNWLATSQLCEVHYTLRV